MEVWVQDHTFDTLAVQRLWQSVAIQLKIFNGPTNLFFDCLLKLMELLVPMTIYRNNSLHALTMANIFYLPDRECAFWRRCTH